MGPEYVHNYYFYYLDGSLDYTIEYLYKVFKEDYYSYYILPYLEDDEICDYTSDTMPIF